MSLTSSRVPGVLLLCEQLHFGGVLVTATFNEQRLLKTFLIWKIVLELT